MIWTPKRSWKHGMCNLGLLVALIVQTGTKFPSSTSSSSLAKVRSGYSRRVTNGHGYAGAGYEQPFPETDSSLLSQHVVQRHSCSKGLKMLCHASCLYRVLTARADDAPWVFPYHRHGTLQPLTLNGPTAFSLSANTTCAP